jgi:hypothetical protein
MKILSSLSSVSNRRMFSSCRYSEPTFIRFGYVGAFVIGGIFSYGLRTDHEMITEEISQFRKEMKDMSTKQQNDNARIVSILEGKKH